MSDHTTQDGNHPLPLMLVGEHRRCLLVGGGSVAAEKLRRLLDVGILPDIIAPAAGKECAALIDEHGLAHTARAYAAGDCAGYTLTVVAAADRELSKQVYEEVTDAGGLINCADVPELCNVFFSANLREGDLTVAVSTNGASAAFGSWLRDRIRLMLPEDAARRLGRLRSLRARLKSEPGDFTKRAAFMKRLIRSDLRKELAGERYDEDALVALYCRGEEPAGSVTLVGAGPGMPSLITMEAIDALSRADAVLYDALANDVLLRYAPADTLSEFVGKRADGVYTRQEYIIERMIELCSNGKNIVRLKGGDPFMFGRGVEEWRALKAAGVSVTSIAGISSPLASLAAAGYPLTERDHCDSVFVTTGYRSVKPGTRLVPDYDPGLVCIVVMARKAVFGICGDFISHGWAPSTPALFISRATLPDQQVLPCPLGRMAALIEAQHPPTPALLAVGDALARPL